MPESIAAIASVFAPAAAATTAEAALANAAILTTGGAAATAGAAGLGAGLGGTILNSAAAGATSAALGGLLAPKQPSLPGVTPMPDPLAQEEARKKSILDQLARRGRDATILTDTSNSGGKLGG